MEDALKSVIGGEKGDQTIRATNAARPPWTLNPLSLAQVNPQRAQCWPQRGPIKSLQATCLAVISRNFHLYSPSSFEGIPPAFTKKVLDRVRHDRSYDTSPSDVSLRPDESTIWAFSLLIDPDSADSTHTLALPSDSTLSHLAPHPTFANPLHPFREIPQLYRTLQPESPIRLMTTLHLDGVDDLVTDHTIMSLKWAENLTVLRTTGCQRVTVAGIRLLASALQLSGEGGLEGRGMCRLRAWYLDGCRGVGDRSMVSFARWPGLLLLDLRNTSCTSAALDIFNRNVETLYSGQLAIMQQCSMGLRPLFARKTSSSDIVDRLAQTILVPDTGPVRQTLLYRSLNLIPSYSLPPPQYLPSPTPLSPNLSKQDYAFSRSTTYRSGGLGQLYGIGVDRITDETQSFRREVSTALYMQALEEGLVKEDKPKKNGSSRDTKPDMKGHTESVGYNGKHKAGKAYKLKKGERDDRSKRFVTSTGNIRAQGKAEDIGGEEELMLVRVAQEGWDRLNWTLGAAHAAATNALQSQASGKPKVDLIGELIGLAQTSNPISTQKKSIVPARTLFRPTARSSNAYSSPSQSGSSPSFSQTRSTNPLSTSTQYFNGFGIKPLSNPLVGRGADREAEGFASTGKKRCWGGGEATEAKRKGMKMFSGTRL